MKYFWMDILTNAILAVFDDEHDFLEFYVSLSYEAANKGYMEMRKG